MTEEPHTAKTIPPLTHKIYNLLWFRPTFFLTPPQKAFWAPLVSVLAVQAVLIDVTRYCFRNKIPYG